MSARQGGTETVSDGGEEEERNEGNVQGLKTTKEKKKEKEAGSREAEENFF